MHMGIAVLVYADNELDALSNAMKIADRLVERDDFDYHSDFNGGGEEFGDLDFSKALPMSNPKVKELVDLYMTFTKEDFMRNLTKIRETLGTKTDDELWCGKDDMWRHYAYVIGQYSGSNVRIYDQDGEGVRDEGHLERVLNKWSHQTNDYDDLDIYVYFQDVHY